MTDRLRLWDLLAASLFDRCAGELPVRYRAAAKAVPDCWLSLISLANVNLMTAAFWAALGRHGLRPLVPAREAEYLASFHEYNAARNRGLREQALECMRALNECGICPMPIKGTAYLLSELYDDIGERFLADIDLMLPPARVEEARGVLHALGYRRDDGFDESGHHHLAPLVREDAVAAVELHRAAVPAYAEPALPTAALWARALACTAEGVEYRLPACTDAAMLAFLHTVVVDRNLRVFWVPLRPLLDLHRLRGRHGEEIDWAYILRRAGTIGAAGECRRFLNLLHRLIGNPALDGSTEAVLDRLHFAICRTAVARPRLTRWILRVDRLSARRIREEREVDGGFAVMTRERIKEVGAMLARGWRG